MRKPPGFIEDHRGDLILGNSQQLIHHIDDFLLTEEHQSRAELCSPYIYRPPVPHIQKFRKVPKMFFRHQEIMENTKLFVKIC